MPKILKMDYKEWVDKNYKWLKETWLDLILDDDELRDQFRNHCLWNYDRYCEVENTSQDQNHEGSLYIEEHEETN